MECGICCDEYSDENPPKILTGCGHTVCSECMQKLQRPKRLSGIVVECPNCRVETKVEDIRTNFVVTEMFRHHHPNSKESPQPSYDICGTHPVKPVTVFCTMCSLFICNECFETSESVHALHPRVSVAEGLGRVTAKVKEMTEKLETCFDRVSVESHEEELRVHVATIELEKIAHNATQHYTHVVEQLKSQLDHLLRDLSQYHGHIASDLHQLVSKRDTLKSVISQVPHCNDVESARIFLNAKHRLEAMANSSIDSDGITNAMNQVSLGVRGGGMGPIPLPKIRYTNLSNSLLFETEFPPLPTRRTDPAPKQGKVLHRSTSNDELAQGKIFQSHR